jgi:hypothetical protein
MMSKSSVNALLAGGGLLATWLAVTPATSIAPTRSTLAVTPAPAGAVRETTLEELNLQEIRLRDHLASAPLPPSARNPFRFGQAPVRQTPRPEAVAPVIAPAPPAQPVLSLSGIFTDKATRTAAITGNDQLYLVKEGELVAGRYTVVTVGADAVTLRDESGTETRLSLP